MSLLLSLKVCVPRSFATFLRSRVSRSPFLRFSLELLRQKETILPHFSPAPAFARSWTFFYDLFPSPDRTGSFPPCTVPCLEYPGSIGSPRDRPFLPPLIEVDPLAGRQSRSPPMTPAFFGSQKRAAIRAPLGIRAWLGPAFVLPRKTLIENCTSILYWQDDHPHVCRSSVPPWSPS